MMVPRSHRSAPAAVAAVLLAAGLVAAAGCGREIGDSCVLPSDCSSDGTVTCDQASRDGYCTIPGCDFGTCPDEAVCIRFFTASFEDLPCTPATEDLPGGPGAGATNDCGLDEVCTLVGECVPTSSEVRYCMRTCESGDDCRSGYECRDRALMIAHGGEPVPPPGEREAVFESFCAEAPGP